MCFIEVNYGVTEVRLADHECMRGGACEGDLVYNSTLTYECDDIYVKKIKSY
jgi:hypothetical protein